MKLLGAYLARHGKLLLLLTGSMFICAWIFFLYGLPVESVGYAAVLCGALGLVLFAVDYVQFLHRHRELARLLAQVKETVLPLPPPRGLLEEDYQTLLQALASDRNALSMGNRNRLQDMTDYYTDRKSVV